MKIEPLYINPGSYKSQYDIDARNKINEIIAFLNTLQPEEAHNPFDLGTSIDSGYAVSNASTFSPEEEVQIELCKKCNCMTKHKNGTCLKCSAPETQNTWEEEFAVVCDNIMLSGGRKIEMKSFISSLLIQTRTEERERLEKEYRRGEAKYVKPSSND